MRIVHVHIHPAEIGSHLLHPCHQNVTPISYSISLARRLDRQRFVLFIRASYPIQLQPSCGGCGIHECFGLLGPTRDLWCRRKSRFVCPMRTRVLFPFLCSHATPCIYYSQSQLLSTLACATPTLAGMNSAQME